MTKDALIEEVSWVVEVPLKQGHLMVELMLDSMVRALRAGDKVELRGFGSFRTRQRGARIARNPKTGARVNVPAKKIPYFRASRELKELVNRT